MPAEEKNSPDPKPKTQQQQKDKESEPEKPEPEKAEKENDSSYSSDSENEEEEEEEEEDDEPPLEYVRPGESSETATANTAEENIKAFERVLKSKGMKRMEEEEEEEIVEPEELFDFPEDPENWTEEDLREMWADAPLEYTKPGWDPDWADEEDWEIMMKEEAEGRDPPIAPFYVPYRPPYPVIPDNHNDISTPKSVIEELDRIEEFLKWVSYIFADGSTYEGTVWDDLAHGRGVYVSEMGLVRYEGEWFRNDMSGHGVSELEIPTDEPVPGSKHEEQMRAEGKIIERDYMTPEDREWLEMDIEDSLILSEGQYEIPWYERDEWTQYFGAQPEKGRYRYAGQWKHGRMHGCGQYEVNERTVYGRFYFGRLLEEPYGCEDEIAAMHASIAEVAAAKARMFINKPDGMVREQRGPYGDPQHPYFYEEEDVWMAPGFINQFYDVPDYWKTYVHEVDKEREMWLNSFYRSPLRLPMPAELEYWWQNEDTPEFVLLNTEPKPDPKDPSKKTIEPVILHTPSGRLINYTMDEEYGVRLYWEPEDGVVDPDKVEYLPLGFDEFYGRDTSPKKPNFLERFFSSVDKACKPYFEKLNKWMDEHIEHSRLNLEVIKKELELVEAEICLEEAIEDMEKNMKKQEKEEQKKVEMGQEEAEAEEEKEKTSQPSAKQDEKAVVEEDEEEEEEEDGDDEDDDAPSSFGSANVDQKENKSDQKGGKPGQSPFSATSLSFATSGLVSGIPSLLQQSFLSWKKNRLIAKPTLPSRPESLSDSLPRVDSVSFQTLFGSKIKLITKSQSLELRAKNHHSYVKACRTSCSASLKKPKENGKRERTRNCSWLHGIPESELDSVLSLHTPVDCFVKYEDTKCANPLSTSI